MSLSSALSTSFGLAPGDSAHEIEIAAKHGVQPPAAPAADDIAHHRRGAFAVAANDDRRGRQRGQKLDGRGKLAALRRILLRAGDDGHARDGAARIVLRRIVKHMQSCLCLQRSERAEAGNVQDWRALGFA